MLEDENNPDNSSYIWIIKKDEHTRILEELNRQFDLLVKEKSTKFKQEFNANLRDNPLPKQYQKRQILKYNRFLNSKKNLLDKEYLLENYSFRGKISELSNSSFKEIQDPNFFCPMTHVIASIEHLKYLENENLVEYVKQNSKSNKYSSNDYAKHLVLLICNPNSNYHNGGREEINKYLEKYSIVDFELSSIENALKKYRKLFDVKHGSLTIEFNKWKFKERLKAWLKECNDQKSLNYFCELTS